MNIFILEEVVLHYHDIMPHSLYHLVICKCHHYYCYYHVLILIPSKEYIDVYSMRYRYRWNELNE